MTCDPPAPPGVDVTRKSVARMYNYFLGGKDNFAIDRAAAEQVVDVAPEVPAIALANRAFLGRAVRQMCDQGIRQFIDIGTGLPNEGNVHQIAHQIDPQARVLYVDFDPVVLAHAQAVGNLTDTTAIILEDARAPEKILNHPDTHRLIDFSKPVGLVCVAIIHFIADADDPHQVMEVFRDAVAPGSHLAISHITSSTGRATAAADAAAIYDDANATATLRTREEINAFFGDWDLVEPGLVPVTQWRPEQPAAIDSDTMWIFGGVADKPSRPYAADHARPAEMVPPSLDPGAGTSER